MFKMIFKLNETAEAINRMAVIEEELEFAYRMQQEALSYGNQEVANIYAGDIVKLQKEWNKLNQLV